MCKTGRFSAEFVVLIGKDKYEELLFQDELVLKEEESEGKEVEDADASDMES